MRYEIEENQEHAIDLDLRNISKRTSVQTFGKAWAGFALNTLKVVLIRFSSRTAAWITLAMYGSGELCMSAAEAQSDHITGVGGKHPDLSHWQAPAMNLRDFVTPNPQRKVW